MLRASSTARKQPGRAATGPSWGEPPWSIEFAAESGEAAAAGHSLPKEVDVAVIGGGFTGLAAAAWLRRCAPEKSVVLLEARRLGSGASGRTGGILLGESAAGELPGLGDVLAGFRRILQELDVDCGLNLSGVWEIARRSTRSHSPIVWQDSGTLRVAHEVPGGTVDPGKMTSGLARAAHGLGAMLRENTPVWKVSLGKRIELELPARPARLPPACRLPAQAGTGRDGQAGGPHSRLCARQALFATNAQSLELTGLSRHAQSKFTLAAASEPLEEDRLAAIGLGRRKAFYTIDLPYLWGRVLENNAVVWGGGLVHLRDWRDFDALDVASGQPAELLAGLQRRVQGLHPALRAVKFTHRWGGPILFANAWRPVLMRHPRSDQALVLGGYSGHGVALSVYLGSWAAEILLREREPPAWGAVLD